MADSSEPEVDKQSEKSNEHQMESTSHTEINCNSTIKPEEEANECLKIVGDLPDSSLDKSVRIDTNETAIPSDSMQVRTEDSESVPLDTNTSQTESNIETAIPGDTMQIQTEDPDLLSLSTNTCNVESNIQIAVTGIVDAVSVDSATDSAETEINVIQDVSSTVTEKSVPEEVNASTVNHEQKSPNISEQGKAEVVVHMDEEKSETVELPKKNIDESSTSAMDVNDNNQEKSVPEDKNKPSDSKEVYRETIDVSDSESEDSDSSSISSLSSPSKSESDSDDEIAVVARKKKPGCYPVIKAKGELFPEDLPPLDELHITVPSSCCAEIGVVTSIVKTLVVIQALKTAPVLDLDSVLFLDKGSRSLGMVFDVFGPVNEPLYCVRFNSPEHIAEFNVKPGDQVYYAPQTEHSKYVFVQQLLKIKGSDACGVDDIERYVQIEYSDDEEERRAWKQRGDELKAEEERDEDPDNPKRKRDPNEVLENKKKFAPQSTPSARGQRGGPRQFEQRPRQPYRQRQQYRPPHHQGPIHPPTFNVPPPSIPGPSVPRQNPPMENTYSGYSMPQPSYNNQPYQNPTQPNSAFGQLPYGQPQIDPRVFQFGAQFAQMVCNLQNSSPSVTNAPPPVAPSFTAPYNQPFYSGNQNFNPFYSNQGAPTYSAPPFTSPPPANAPLPPPPPPPPSVQPPYPSQPNTVPNQNNVYGGGQYGSTYPGYPNRR